MAVMGRLRQDFGLVFFANLNDYLAFAKAAHAPDDSDLSRIPPYFSLHFERGAGLDPSLRREIGKHRWEVAGAHAYPVLSSSGAGLAHKPVEIEELAITQAAALALAQAVKDKDFAKAWRDELPWLRTFPVKTLAGEVEVTLDVPQLSALIDDEGFSENEDLDDHGSNFGHEMLKELLLQQFQESKEGRALEEVFYLALVMELASSYFRQTIIDLAPGELSEIIFELIPGNAMIPASEAPRIIKELRAYYRFLRRQIGFSADRYLRVLGKNAINKLETALSNSDNFNIGKQLISEMADKDGQESSLPLGANQPAAESRAERKAEKKTGKRATGKTKPGAASEAGKKK